MSTTTTTTRPTGLDHQVAVLLAAGWGELSGLGDAGLAAAVEPLQAVAAGVPAAPGPDPGRLPLVLVVPGVPPRAAVEAVTWTGRSGAVVSGWADLPDDELARFVPIEGEQGPDGPYLLVDVDTGRETLDVVPDDALPRLRAQGRHPLTVTEGLAVLVQHPRIVRDANAFSLLASRYERGAPDGLRRQADKRVPAIWTSSAGGVKRPRLGWCWAGNPHTWLGSASAAARLTA